MLKLLRHPVFAKLYAAQVVSLLGTGLATVALGLLAFELAGENAGSVLGIALAIKMVAYVGVAPIAQALLGKYPTKTVLIVLDLIRAAIALSLPFVSEIWQIYVLIFVLQSASAGFTPTFQALIPDILPDEGDYTNALSLSRLTYDLENLISPTLAAILLSVMSFHWLFAGTALGFCLSALFVLTASIHGTTTKTTRPFLERVFGGTKRYLATPRLRGLLSLNLAAAAGSSMVIVNTIVITRSGFGLGAQSVGIALTAYGAGSMIAALTLPGILAKTGDRLPMLGGAVILTVSMFAGGILFANQPTFPALLLLWAVAGIGYSATLTPVGRLLNRSAHAQDRPEIFAAQFALSHACWLVTYPLAGWVGASFGIPAAFVTLGVIAAIAVISSLFLWPRQTGGVLEHDHTNLPTDHPHLKDADDGHHNHKFVIDDLHEHWPTNR